MNNLINRLSVIWSFGGIITIGFALVFSNVLSAADRSVTSLEDCTFGVATAQNFEGATGDTVTIIVPNADDCTSLIVSGVLLSDPGADVKQWTATGGEVTLQSTGTQAGPNGSDYTYTLVPVAQYNIEVRVALNGTPSAPAAIKIGDGTTYNQFSWQSSTQSSGPSGSSSSSSGTPATASSATAVPTMPFFGLFALGGLVGLFGLRKLKK